MKCPVCEIGEIPRLDNFDICKRCGVEFGNDDSFVSHEELKLAYAKAGYPDWEEERKHPDFHGGVNWLDRYLFETAL